jgi:trimethylamine-N-oxide reductase (cytochrome c)
MQDAMRHESIECIVVQHPWMENETLLADIILPSNTKFETEDIGTDSDSGQWNTVFWEQRAIKPRLDSKSDKEVVGEVAKRLEQFGGVYEDLYQRYLGHKTDDEWIRIGFDTCGAPEDLSFETFKEKQFYPFPTRKDWKDLPAGLIEFYNDPEGHPLGTPSGKLEYYSTSLAQYFPDDTERQPIPKWIDESTEHKERQYLDRGCSYPFLLVSNHPHFRVHAQHDDVTWLREIETCKVVGPDGYRYEPIWVNPIDAGKLGLKTGDIARIYNERGGVLGGIIVTERIIPNTIYQDHGSRVDSIVLGAGGLDRGGANNLIAPTAITSKNAAGEVTSGFLVNIEKVDVFALAKRYPEAFKRPFDPDCGIIAAARIVEGA